MDFFSILTKIAGVKNWLFYPILQILAEKEKVEQCKKEDDEEVENGSFWTKKKVHRVLFFKT